MKSITIGLWGLLLIALIILGPFLTIWALNTLFPVIAIPYTLETWFAAILIHGLFRTSITTKK